MKLLFQNRLFKKVINAKFIHYCINGSIGAFVEIATFILFVLYSNIPSKSSHLISYVLGCFMANVLNYKNVFSVKKEKFLFIILIIFFITFNYFIFNALLNYFVNIFLIKMFCLIFMVSLQYWLLKLIFNNR